jgi:hypothetical protein
VRPVEGGDGGRRAAIDRTPNPLTRCISNGFAADAAM